MDDQKLLWSICPLSFTYFSLFQIPADTKSTLPLGHTFVIAGTVEGSTFIGVHGSFLRVHPHIYHAVAEFRFKKRRCAEAARRAHAAIKQSVFLNIRYNLVSQLWS